MKTTIDIPDALFREAKATAARRGRPLREFVTEAVAEKLEREEGSSGTQASSGEWLVPPPDIPSDEIARVQAIIDAEFDQIEPEHQIDS